MRGSAQPPSGRPAVAALRASWQGTLRPPCTPDQEAALPLVGSPASDLSGSDTPGQRVRPFAFRAHGALLPETPARKELSPLSALSPFHGRRIT